VTKACGLGTCPVEFVPKVRERQRTQVAKDIDNRGTKMNLLKRLWQEEEGQDLVEYALLVVLIALAAVVGMQTLATDINNVFLAAGANLTANT
jgi:pilus assembly protein Flp/PilA